MRPIRIWPPPRRSGAADDRPTLIEQPMPVEQRPAPAFGADAWPDRPRRALRAAHAPPVADAFTMFVDHSAASDIARHDAEPEPIYDAGRLAPADAPVAGGFTSRDAGTPAEPLTRPDEATRAPHSIPAAGPERPSDSAGDAAALHDAPDALDAPPEHLTLDPAVAHPLPAEQPAAATLDDVIAETATDSFPPSIPPDAEDVPVGFELVTTPIDSAIGTAPVGADADATPMVDASPGGARPEWTSPDDTAAAGSVELFDSPADLPAATSVTDRWDEAEPAAGAFEAASDEATQPPVESRGESEIPCDDAPAAAPASEVYSEAPVTDAREAAPTALRAPAPWPRLSAVTHCEYVAVAPSGEVLELDREAQDARRALDERPAVESPPRTEPVESESGAPPRAGGIPSVEPGAVAPATSPVLEVVAAPPPADDTTGDATEVARGDDGAASIDLFDWPPPDARAAFDALWRRLFGTQARPARRRVLLLAARAEDAAADAALMLALSGAALDRALRPRVIVLSPRGVSPAARLGAAPDAARFVVRAADQPRGAGGAVELEIAGRMPAAADRPERVEIAACAPLTRRAARRLRGWPDAVLLVVRIGATPRGAILRALRYVRAAGLPPPALLLLHPADGHTARRGW